MKKLLLPTLFAAMLVLAACSPAPITAAPTATELPPEPSATFTIAPPTPTNTALPPSPTSETTILEIVGPDDSVSLTMSELMALPSVEGQAGIKSSTGRITPPLAFTGVTIETLAGLVGGLDPSLGVNVVAGDGYVMTLSYDQITQGQFIAYDPATGDERKMEEDLTIAVVYQRDGQPIGEDEGPLRLAILSPKNNQVTDGHWSVKWVTRIELQPIGMEWDLELHGVIDDTLDRNTFQSCSAPGCHQATWIDEEGQTWSGTPLWLFAGRVDDEIKHDGPAFFDLMAQLGYSVQVVATDGYSTTFEISEVAYSDRNILLAYLVDDAPLPEKYFPLRLVGPGLEKGQMVGGIEKINLIFDPAKATQAASVLPTKAPTTTAVEQPSPVATQTPRALPEADLIVNGLVDAPLALNESDLRGMALATISAEHPKQGDKEYEGVRLQDLLDTAGLKSEAKTVVFTASDGYSIEMPLADLQPDVDYLIAFTDTEGIFQLVMPGLESSLWVKGLVQIEIK